MGILFNKSRPKCSIIQSIMNLFLIKEIRNKSGELHFQRWRILSTPWFNIFIHKIFKSDTDHQHNHPWSFLSIILKGVYDEFNSSFGFTRRNAGSISYKKAKEFHSFNPVKPTTSLVITGPINNVWGYKLHGHFVENEEYRRLKRGNHLFSMFDQVIWNTSPNCPYENQSGVVQDIKFDVKLGQFMATVKWEDGTINKQPIDFLVQKK